jgi:pimeloyl-ACP methyl ester carboxylesterase
MRIRFNKRRLTLVAVMCYVLVMTFGGCADHFVLPPLVHSSNSDGTTRYTVPHGDGLVENFRARSPGATNQEPKAFVLEFTGGNACDAAKFLASRWEHRPVEVWVANYPGYGQSTGPRTLKALASAALTCFDEVKRMADKRPIFLEGFSLGTTPALHVAANRPVDGMILQNPPPLRQLILGTRGWWNLWLVAGPVALQIPSELDSTANAQQASAPALFLFAEKDRTVPLKYQQMISDKYAGTKRVIVQVGADHVAPLNQAEEVRLHDAMDWLLSLSAAKG